MLVPLVLIFLGIVSLGAPFHASLSPRKTVLVAEIRGAITPVTLEYVSEAIARASKGFELLVFEMDTPGGYVSTTEEIIQEIAAARVTERGGRADDKRSETAMEDRKKDGYF